MKINVHVSLNPHPMLTEIGAPIPILFAKTIKANLNLGVLLPSLLARVLPIGAWTFCSGQQGFIRRYDEATKTLIVEAPMASATPAYFKKLQAAGWKPDEQAVSSRCARYQWSEAQEAKYNEEQRIEHESQEALGRLMKTRIKLKARVLV